MGRYRQVTHIATLATFLGTLLLFYSQTAEFVGSLAAALITTALVWLSFIILGWLIQVFTK